MNDQKFGASPVGNAYFMMTYGPSIITNDQWIANLMKTTGVNMCLEKGEFSVSDLEKIIKESQEALNGLIYNIEYNTRQAAHYGKSLSKFLEDKQTADFRIAQFKKQLEEAKKKAEEED